MNNKLLLQDLTDQLAESGKIKKKDAEEFLRAFFKISEDALFEDGIVKINGLGTLKLVLVDARKSVNVSTGEEFEIREHYKVSFVPDADLKSSVNQPYAHLEPVELDPVPVPSVAVSAEKKSAAGKEKASKTEADSPNNEPKNPRKMKRATIAWIVFFLVIAAFGVWSWISNVKHNREDAAKSQENALIDSLEADANLKADLEALNQENGADSLHSSAADDSLEAAIESVANEPGAAQPAPSAAPAASKPVAPAATVAKPVAGKPAAPAAAVAKPAAAATPAAKPVASTGKPVATAAPIAKPSATSAKPAAPATKTAATAPTTAKPAAVTTKTASTVTTTVKEPATTPKTASTATTTKTTAPAVKTTTPVVKTTAPAVKTTPSVAPVEYLATVVLKPGDRLNLLSLKYYGDKIFWVYIYQANKNVIPDPDHVPVGITVRIPKPDPKLIDPKNEALVAKAKALQLQYIGAQ